MEAGAVESYVGYYRYSRNKFSRDWLNKSGNQVFRDSWEGWIIREGSQPEKITESICEDAKIHSNRNNPYITNCFFLHMTGDKDEDVSSHTLSRHNQQE